MLRILILIGLILLAIPFFNKVMDYSKGKIHQAKEAGEDFADKAKNIGSAVKDSVNELPQKIKDKNDGK